MYIAALHVCLEHLLVGDKKTFAENELTPCVYRMYKHFFVSYKNSCGKRVDSWINTSSM